MSDPIVDDEEAVEEMQSAPTRKRKRAPRDPSAPKPAPRKRQRKNEVPAPLPVYDEKKVEEKKPAAKKKKRASKKVRDGELDAKDYEGRKDVSIQVTYEVLLADDDKDAVRFLRAVEAAQKKTPKLKLKIADLCDAVTLGLAYAEELAKAEQTTRDREAGELDDVIML